MTKPKNSKKKKKNNKKKYEKKLHTVNPVNAVAVSNDAAGSSQNLIEGDICLESFCKTSNIEGPHIFEIESRTIKHSNKDVCRMAVKPGWTSAM